jgi:flagellar M-ring protein FliF
MSEEEIKPLRTDRKILRLMLALGSGLSVLLAVIYFVFFQTERVVLFQDLRTSDAAQIVDLLEAQGVDVSLTNAGTTIMVPKSEVDRLRLDIASANLPLGGADGFELFDDSDIGLTDFAQRINYQRALQGELARTILMIDGISDVRVHLAVPEKTVFRGERSDPSASVSIQTRPGFGLSPATVDGIQRLVAGAITDLSPAQIVILDDLGRIVSKATEPENLATPESRERRALEQYYAARLKREIEAMLPEQKIDVTVKVIGLDSILQIENAASPDTPNLPSLSSNLRLTILSPVALNQDQKEMVRQAAVTVLGETAAMSAQFVFQRGTGPTESLFSQPDYRAVPDYPPDQPAQNAPVAASLERNVLAIMVLLLVGAALVWLWLRLRGRTALASEDRDAFLARLRAKLGTVQPETVRADG